MAAIHRLLAQRSFNVQRRGLSAEMIMTNTPAQGAAFPIEGYSNGISIRDYFAAKAMAAIVRRWDGHSFGGGPDSPQYKELAEDAYFIADAMLRARESL